MKIFLSLNYKWWVVEDWSSYAEL